MDQCFEKVGYKHKYQTVVFLVIMLQFLISTCFFVLGPFFFRNPIFICQNGQECSEKTACNEVNNDYTKIIIDQQKSGDTVTKEYQLYCSRDNLKSLSQSLIFIGALIGTVISSQISDIFGRKKMYIFTWITCTIGTILLSSANSVYLVMAGLFCGGMGVYPCNSLGFIILSEQSIKQFREITTGYVLVGYTLSEFYIDLLAYVNNDNWRVISIYGLMIPMLLMNIPNFFLVESPRFFISKRNRKAALDSFNQIAKYNSREFITQLEIDKVEIPNESKNYTFIDIMRYKSSRVQVIAASILKFFMMFVLYGTTFTINQIGLNIYVNQLLVAITELVSFPLNYYAIKKVKRKTTCYVLCFVICIVCISFIFLTVPKECQHNDQLCWQKYLQLTIFCFGRFCQNIVFSIFGMYFPELFPTSIRGMGTLTIRAIGVGGSILSPYSVQISNNIGVQPLIPVGVIGLSSLFSIYFLEETLNQELRDEIEEELNQSMKTIIKEKEYESLEYKKN